MTVVKDFAFKFTMIKILGFFCMCPQKLCEGILHILEKDTKTSCQVACLEALRILSRDKKVLVPVTTKENMQILMRLAKLDMTEDSLEDVSNFPVIVEALKCLCNIVFNSAIAQKLSLELNLAAMLCNLLKKCKDQQFVDDIKCFDLRLLFLLSLLHTEIRSQLHHELQGLQVLTQALESSFSIRWTDKYKAAEEHDGSPLSLQETDCAIEALKALFNVTLDSWNVHSEVRSEFKFFDWAYFVCKNHSHRIVKLEKQLPSHQSRAFPCLGQYLKAKHMLKCPSELGPQKGDESLMLGKNFEVLRGK